MVGFLQLYPRIFNDMVVKLIVVEGVADRYGVLVIYVVLYLYFV